MEETVNIETGEIQQTGVEYSRIGLILDEDLPYEAWEKIGTQLKNIEGSIQWWVGDWVNFGERKYGEMYAQAMDATGNDYGTLRNQKFVASKIELSRRRDNLSWSHHYEVAALEPEIADYLLQQSEENGWSRAELRNKVKENKYLELHNKELTDGSIANIIINGDFRTADIPDNSIDLILTDPPYGGEFSDTWEALGIFANRVLKPSRFLISYFGQLNLNEFYSALGKNLNYYWTFCLQHTGNTQLILPRNVFCGWKPLLVFQKSPFHRLDIAMDDVVRGSGREKGDHEWQQGLDELEILVDKFSIEGETILDPFCGSGTTLIASMKKNRKAIGIEIDENYCKIASERIYGIQND